MGTQSRLSENCKNVKQVHTDRTGRFTEPLICISNGANRHNHRQRQVDFALAKLLSIG